VAEFGWRIRANIFYVFYARRETVDYPLACLKTESKEIGVDSISL
jgi:hypothetical protein